MALRVTGANSPAGLASDPVRYLLLDEVDKFPPFSGREADPVSLSMERTRTFWDRRVVMTSTPTTRAGSIWREYELSDQRRFHVPCLGCGKFMILESENVRRPGDVRDPDMIEREDLARYICPRCKHEHQEVDKRPMLARGRWVPAGAEVTDGGVVVGDQNSRHRGYQLSALYSPWVSWSAVLAEYLRAKDDVARYMNFVNSWLGWIWEERLEARDAADLLALAAGHASGTVPKGTVVLTAGVDVQADLFYYAIRAWGYGEESWLVECGRVETWEALENAMFRREFKEHGGDEHAAKFSVRQAAIDSGYRTHEVYDFCRRWRAVARPVKGQERLAGMPIKPVRVERDGRGVVIVGGLQLWHVDTNFFKDALAQFWSGDRDGAPARFHLHADPPDEYCRHLASEHKIVIRNRTGAVKEVWSRRPGGGPNHWFDAEVYAMAAAHMLGVFGLRRPDGPSEAPIDPERDERAPKPWAAAGRPAAQWVGKRRGGRWVR
jgi:phage terminase large subunit GpA-like protein